MTTIVRPFSTTKDIEATNFKGLKMRINQLYYTVIAKEVSGYHLYKPEY